MRRLLAFVVYMLSMMFAEAEITVASDTSAKEQIIKLLQNGEGYCLPCSHIYQTFRQSDSLARLLSIKEKDELFTNEDPTVRYYAFLDALATDEEKAFERLGKSLKDSAEICFMCCVTLEEKVNEKIFSHYYTYLYLKYHEGCGGTVDARSYFFGKINRDQKRWKEKINRLMLLAKDSPYYLQLAATKDRLDRYFKNWR